MKKILLILALFITTATIIYKHSNQLTHVIIKYHYFQSPKDNKNFYVYVNSRVGLPQFLQNIIKEAFKDKNVIFDNNSPIIHLIVHDYLNQHITMPAKPAILFSGENLIKKPKKFTPFLEFISNTPQHNRQLYFPIISWSGIQPKRQFKQTNRKKFLAYINSNCLKHREELFKLIAKKRIGADALGPCSNTIKNKITPRADGSWQSLPEIYSLYNFAFALENTKAPGYVTEKIITAFNGGTIPIYWGDSNTVNQWFNKKSYIDVSDFKTPEEAAHYIVELSNDPIRIEKMLQEPMLKNLDPPEILQLEKSHNTLITDAAKKLRKGYFADIEQNKTKYTPNILVKLFYKIQNNTYH